MGVYIPNMEKPKECGDCNFVQAFWDDKRWLFRCLVTDKIAEDCPLIEIEEWTYSNGKMYVPKGTFQKILDEERRTDEID